jgi:energy-coupling factor transporter ATP-binding protein EcfA2
MIRRLYVHNFRCLENFELPVSKRPTALLIGGNGTGKSTVGSALEILQRIARGTNRVRDLLTPSDFAWGRSDVPIRLEIESILGGQPYEYILALELPHGFRELRVAEERLSIDGQRIYSRDRDQVTFFRTIDKAIRSTREAKFLVDWHLVALPLIQVQSDKDPLHVFKTWLARMLILAPIPSLIEGDSQGDTLMPNRSVTDFGEWLSGLLAQSPAAYTVISEFLKRVMPDLQSIQNPTVGKNSRSLSVQFQQDQATLSLPFGALSDGEKCFFICAVVLAANQEYGPILCFWDEPDNHLSPSEVGHFVMDLRRSFQSRGQFLATSHNPEAISQFSRENTLLLQRRSHLEPTIVRPMSELAVHGDLIDAMIRGDLVP